MSLRVNLSNVESGSFDPIPAGKYPLNVFDGELRESGDNAKHPGAQYIAWEFIVASGEFEDRHLWDNTIFSHDGCDCGDSAAIEKFEKGFFKLKGLLAATQKWSAEELDSDEFTFDIEDVIGSSVLAGVTRRNDPEYGESNVIKSYKVLDPAEVGSSSVLP